MRAELSKFAVMDSCFEMNFLGFIPILLYSMLFNLEIVKIREKNRTSLQL